MHCEKATNANGQQIWPDSDVPIAVSFQNASEFVSRTELEDLFHGVPAFSGPGERCLSSHLE
jgi:hypothetical protein